MTAKEALAKTKEAEKAMISPTIEVIEKYINEAIAQRKYMVVASIEFAIYDEVKAHFLAKGYHEVIPIAKQVFTANATTRRLILSWSDKKPPKIEVKEQGSPVERDYKRMTEHELSQIERASKWIRGAFFR